MLNETLLKSIQEQRWTNAKSYQKFAPHEYILKQDNPKLFNAMKEKILFKGVDEQFRIFKTVKTYRYFYFKGYKYWIMDIVLNRVRVKEDKNENTNSERNRAGKDKQECL